MSAPFNVLVSFDGDLAELLSAKKTVKSVSLKDRVSLSFSQVKLKSTLTLISVVDIVLCANHIVCLDRILNPHLVIYLAHVKVMEV